MKGQLQDSSRSTVTPPKLHYIIWTKLAPKWEGRLNLSQIDIHHHADPNCTIPSQIIIRRVHFCGRELYKFFAPDSIHPTRRCFTFIHNTDGQYSSGRRVNRCTTPRCPTGKTRIYYVCCPFIYCTDMETDIPPAGTNPLI